jgi:hypothetical protein
MEGLQLLDYIRWPLPALGVSHLCVGHSVNLSPKGMLQTTHRFAQASADGASGGVRPWETPLKAQLESF